MDPKKDIGTLLKQKLDDATKEANTELWNKIEVSLDKRDRKRRGFFFFWVGSGTAAVILLLLYLNHSIFDKENTNQGVPKTEIATENMEAVSSTSEFKTEKNNAVIINDSAATTGMSELEQTEPNSLNSSEDNSVTSKRKSSNPNKINKEKDPFMDDSVTIKTTYHYYNGDTKEMLQTTEKRVIDSLLARTKINIDSLKVVETKILNPRKKDSLNQ